MKAAFPFRWNLLYHTVCNIDKTVLLQPSEKLVHVCLITLKLHLNTAVIQVLNPAGQTKILGELIGPVAEADALDPAAYQTVFSDRFFFLHLITFYSMPVIGGRFYCYSL